MSKKNSIVIKNTDSKPAPIDAEIIPPKNKKNAQKDKTTLEFAGTKGVPTYIAVNKDREIVAALVTDSLDQKAISKIVAVLIEVGLIVNHESSADASALFKERRMVDQPGLFDK